MAKGPQRRPTPQLEQTIVREFQGGWNVIDNELNLTPKFAKVMDNWVRAADGSMQVRYGYKFYADCGLIAVDDEVLLTADIVNAVWFQGYLFVVDGNGVIARLSNNNTGIRIWDSTIAGAQTGSPSSWGTTQQVNFFSFNGKLIALNGVDPPLEIDNKNTPICQYLADPSTGSNYAIPKAAFGISTQGYPIVAGDTLLPTTLHIGAKNELGVFYGNANPDDAVDIDMSRITSTVDSDITGLGQLRGTLVVAYRDGLSLGTFGTSSTPTFDDQISLSGCISHRSIVSLGSDMFLCDRVGVPSLSRSSFGQLIPDRISQLVEPELQRNISRLTEDEARYGIFAVFNPREQQYMLFVPKFTNSTIQLPDDPISTMAPDDSMGISINIPNHCMDEGDTFQLRSTLALPYGLASEQTVVSVLDVDNVRVIPDTTAYYTQYANVGGPTVTLNYTRNRRIGYILTYNPKLKIQAWSRFRDMDFNWGCVDIAGRTYFGKGKKVYVFGTVEEPLSADRIGDYDFTWTNNTAYNVGDIVFDVIDQRSYVCEVAHTSRNTGVFADDRIAHIDYWTDSNGVAINFAWEWPWGDFGSRANVKAIRGVKPEAQGKGEFSLCISVDNLYRDGKTGVRTPVRTLSFVPNDAVGFGAGSQPYGAGRRTRDMKVWPLPVNCNIYKLRFEGSTTEPLRIVSVGLLYHKGGLAR